MMANHQPPPIPERLYQSKETVHIDHYSLFSTSPNRPTRQYLLSLYRLVFFSSSKMSKTAQYNITGFEASLFHIACYIALFSYCYIFMLRSFILFIYIAVHFSLILNTIPCMTIWLFFVWGLKLYLFNLFGVYEQFSLKIEVYVFVQTCFIMFELATWLVRFLFFFLWQHNTS